MSPLRQEEVAEITRTLDTTSALSPAEAVLVFGNAMSDPALHAARLYHAGLAPVVVVTGGPHRYWPRHVEADQHARLLVQNDVPPAMILSERRSTSTEENVRFARPLIEERIGPIESVIVVVAWYHMRALLYLVHHFPSVQRIHAFAYEHSYRMTGEKLTRNGWASTSASWRIVQEYTKTTHLLRRLPPLRRGDSCWIRPLRA